MGQAQTVQKDKFTYPSGNTYTGEWKGSKRHGYGVYTWPDGGVYEGYHNDSKLQGGGRMVFPNGSVYEGFFHNNNPAGRGVLTTVAQERVDGEWTFLGRANNAESTWNSPVGRYRFRGVVVDTRTNRATMYCGEAALHLATGLVSLPDMVSPEEPIFAQAVEVMTSAPAESLKREFGMAEEVELGQILEAEVVAADEGAARQMAKEDAEEVLGKATDASSGIQTGNAGAGALAPNAPSNSSYNMFDPRLYFPGLGQPYDYGQARARARVGPR